MTKDRILCNSCFLSAKTYYTWWKAAWLDQKNYHEWLESREAQHAVETSRFDSLINLV